MPTTPTAAPALSAGVTAAEKAALLAPVGAAETHPTRAAPFCGACAHSKRFDVPNGLRSAGMYCDHPCTPRSQLDGKPMVRCEQMRGERWHGGLPNDQALCGPSARLFASAEQAS